MASLASLLRAALRVSEHGVPIKQLRLGVVDCRDEHANHFKADSDIQQEKHKQDSKLIDTIVRELDLPGEEIRVKAIAKKLDICATIPSVGTLHEH
jgi:hypothetical protein